MVLLFRDASALAKRYVIELGTATVNALQHNLNATDAAILALLLDYTRVLPAGRSGCVVIAADRRLLRAADAEGLKTADPEVLAAAAAPAFLAGL